MILVIDVGNTNMTLGVYEGQSLKATFRMMTKTPRTSDEYGVMIMQLLQNSGSKRTLRRMGSAPEGKWEKVTKGIPDPLFKLQNMC